MQERRYLDLIRAKIAGTQAIAVQSAAETLFKAGGKRLMAEGTRAAIREFVEHSAKATLNVFAPQALVHATRAAAEGASSTAKALVAEVAPLLAKEAASSAAKEVLKGVGKGAGVGLVVDGVFGGVEAAVAYKKGEMTGKEAAVYAGKEAATGAVATGAGVALAAGVVALTGGLATPVVFVIGAGTAIGAKHGLRRLIA